MKYNLGQKTILRLANRNFLNFLSDKTYIKLMYYARMGRKINLNDPQTLNEKLNWLKINNRNPLYTQLVDKYEVKNYIAEKLGEEYVIPALGVWDKFEDIDFGTLPDRFVLKCTHDSGGLVICKDKRTFDVQKAKEKINKSLKNNYYYHGREWPYKNVKPRIIAEEYLSPLGEEGLIEYKIFCFNGKAKMVLVCKGPAHTPLRTNDYCDMDLNRLPFTCLFPNSVGELKEPKNYEKMIEIAEKLSENIPQVRIDLYNIDGQIYFGEMTFFHNSGFCAFEPNEWDEKLGEWIELPKEKHER